MEHIFVDIFDLEEEYLDKLLIWRNQEFVRINMSNSNLISKEEHAGYISRVRKNDKYSVHVAFMKRVPYGVINIWLNDDGSHEYGYYLIDEELLDLGLGVILQYWAMAKIFDEKSATTIKLRVVKENKRTISLHRRFGYRLIGEGESFYFFEMDYNEWIKLRPKLIRMRDVSKAIAVKEE